MEGREWAVGENRNPMGRGEMSTRAIRSSNPWKEGRVLVRPSVAWEDASVRPEVERIFCGPGSLEAEFCLLSPVLHPSTSVFFQFLECAMFPTIA